MTPERREEFCKTKMSSPKWSSIRYSMSNKPRQMVHPVIGRCIYCGTTADLTKEHTVPYSLNGALTLKQASCRDCARITSAFERSFTRRLEVARDILGYKTRHKERRKGYWPGDVVIDGKVRTVNIPIDAMAAPVPMLDLGYPTYSAEKYSLREPEHKVGPKRTISKVVCRSQEKKDAFLKSIGAQSLNAKTDFNAYDFARMLAKIAYCETIAGLIHYGYGSLENIQEVYVLDFILRGDGDPWRYIGGQQPILHAQNPKTDPDVRAVSIKDGDFLAHIQLFVPIGGPEYVVVVGRATEALRERLHSEGYDDA